MNKNIIKVEKRNRRRARVRSKIFGTAKKPRLSVFRSSKYIYAQLIDDDAQKTLAAADDKKGKGKKIERAKQVGVALSKKAKAKKITTVVFDRGGYRYHGRIKALADGAREGGLKF